MLYILFLSLMTTLSSGDTKTAPLVPTVSSAQAPTTQLQTAQPAAATLESGKPTATNTGVLGIWLVQDGKAKIEMYKENDVLFGKVVWLLNPNNEKGTPKTDSRNPKEELKTKPILGLVILRDLKPDGDNAWSGGSVYDPESGKSYKAKVTLEKDTLKVLGYIGAPFFGVKRTWSRSSL